MTSALRFVFLIVAALLVEVSGTFSFILFYEVFQVRIQKIFSGKLFGIETPLYYQTPVVYADYCLLWACVFLLLFISGIFFLLSKRKIALLLNVILILLSAAVMAFINAKPHLPFIG